MITGNIHLNPHPRSESEMLWLIFSANTQHYQLINHIHTQTHEQKNKWPFEKNAA